MKTIFQVNAKKSEYKLYVVQYLFMKLCKNTILKLRINIILIIIQDIFPQKAFLTYESFYNKSRLCRALKNFTYLFLRNSQRSAFFVETVIVWVYRAYLQVIMADLLKE